MTNWPLLAALTVALIFPSAAHGASSSGVEVEWVGRKCRDNGNTRVVLKVHNHGDDTIYPNLFATYADTGLVSLTGVIPAEDSGRLHVVIPAGRKIAWLGVYRSAFDESLIFERENIKALECGADSNT